MHIVYDTDMVYFKKITSTTYFNKCKQYDYGHGETNIYTYV